MCTRYLPGHCGLTGNYRQALSVARRGLALIGHPHAAQYTYANLMVKASQALTSLGNWSMAWAHLSECLDVVEDERAAFNVHIMAGLIAGWRGDLATAESHLELASPGGAERGRTLDMRLVGQTWLAAEIADAKGDPKSMRRELALLWAAPHPEVASDILWQPLLLGARVEADLLQWTGETPRTEGSREHLDVCRESPAASTIRARGRSPGAAAGCGSPTAPTVV